MKTTNGKIAGLEEAADAEDGASRVEAAGIHDCMESDDPLNVDAVNDDADGAVDGFDDVNAGASVGVLPREEYHLNLGSADVLRCYRAWRSDEVRSSNQAGHENLTLGKDLVESGSSTALDLLKEFSD